jgi:pre-mRNA-processing factor 40
MLSQCAWREYKAENGRIYYHNVDTKESRWTKPKELEDIEKMVPQQQSSTDSPNTYVTLNSSKSFYPFFLAADLPPHLTHPIFLYP